MNTNTVDFIGHRANTQTLGATAIAHPSPPRPGDSLPRQQRTPVTMTGFRVTRAGVILGVADFAASLVEIEEPG